MILVKVKIVWIWMDWKDRCGKIDIWNVKIILFSDYKYGFLDRRKLKMIFRGLVWVLGWCFRLSLGVFNWDK